MEATARLSARTVFGLLLVAASLLHGAAGFKQMAVARKVLPCPQGPCTAQCGVPEKVMEMRAASGHRRFPKHLVDGLR